MIEVGAMIIEKGFMIFIKLLAYLVVFVLFFGLITIILSIAKDFFKASHGYGLLNHSYFS